MIEKTLLSRLIALITREDGFVGTDEPSGGEPPVTAEPKPGEEPKVFDESYVKELREENKARRLESESLTKSLDDFKVQFENFTTKTKAEKEAMLKALGVDEKTEEDPTRAAMEKINALEQQIKDKDAALVRKEIYSTFFTEAQKAGMSPEMVEDAFRLANIKDVQVNPETGKVEGVAEVLEELKDKKSYLFAKVSPKNAGSGGEPSKEGDEEAFSDEVQNYARELGVDPKFAADLIEKRKKDAKARAGEEGEGRISRAISAFKGAKPPRSTSAIES